MFLENQITQTCFTVAGISVIGAIIALMIMSIIESHNSKHRKQIKIPNWTYVSLFVTFLLFIGCLVTGLIFLIIGNVKTSKSLARQYQQLEMEYNKAQNAVINSKNALDKFIAAHPEFQFTE